MFPFEHNSVSNFFHHELPARRKYHPEYLVRPPPVIFVPHGQPPDNFPPLVPNPNFSQTALTGFNDFPNNFVQVPQENHNLYRDPQEIHQVSFSQPPFFQVQPQSFNGDVPQCHLDDITNQFQLQNFGPNSFYQDQTSKPSFNQIPDLFVPPKIFNNVDMSKPQIFDSTNIFVQNELRNLMEDQVTYIEEPGLHGTTLDESLNLREENTTESEYHQIEDPLKYRQQTPPPMLPRYPPLQLDPIKSKKPPIHSNPGPKFKRACRPTIQNCCVRSIDDFFIKRVIGNGTFGQVWEAIDHRDGSLVAIKLVKMERERNGVPITALREIRLLQSMRHPNILNLKEVINKVSSRNIKKGELSTQGSLYMVFDYIENDLAGLLEMSPQDLTPIRIKTFMLQLLDGLAYMHGKNILHRDLKCANLLITRDGVLKIADWGLARVICQDPTRQYTQKVVTRWYRPPELLLLSKNYGFPVDIWSAGCIFGEMIAGRPIFPGKDEIDQLWQIFSLLGTPTLSSWPSLDRMPDYNAFRLTYEPRSMESTLQDKLGEQFAPHPLALELMKHLLACDPSKRLTAAQARDHLYFKHVPLPGKYGELPPLSSTGFHEQEAKMEARNQHSRVKKEMAEYQAKSGLTFSTSMEK